MIVRIMGDQQYRVDSEELDHLNQIDNSIVRAIEENREDQFKQDLQQLVNQVRTRGRPVEDSEYRASDVIVPPEDLTLDEARRIFTGDGVIPE